MFFEENIGGCEFAYYIGCELCNERNCNSRKCPFEDDEPTIGTECADLLEEIFSGNFSL